MVLQEQVRRRLKGLLDEYNFPRRNEGNSESVDKIVTVISSRLNQSLPEDYLYFLANYRGHEIGINKHTVILWDTVEVQEMNESSDILEYFNDVLSIGGNGAGESIGLDFSTTPSSVVLFPLINIDREDFIKIGDSFLDFIERLDRGIPWFS